MPQQLIYLDYAAATPVDDRVVQAMQPFWSDQFYNPSATYNRARKVHAALEQARSSVARWLGARPSEIIFTAGGSEANNLAIHGIMGQHPGKRVVVSGVEHESVLMPARRYDCQEAKMLADGRIDLEALKSSINDQTVLVSIMYANNEIGTIEPLREISRLLAEIRHARQAAGNSLPLYFHTDAAQAGNYLDLHVARLGVDMMTLNGGKIYGPKQSGVLYVKAGLALQPLIDGGGQERGLRSGTENVAQAVGLATALNIAQERRHEEAKRLHNLQQLLIKQLETSLPAAAINGSLKQRLPNNVHVTFPGLDNERLLIELDEAGVVAAAGSACSASDEESSHVLHAIGLSDAEARASVRFTMGRGTNEAEITQTVNILQKLVTAKKH